jgi:hypothetical protein
MRHSLLFRLDVEAKERGNPACVPCARHIPNNPAQPLEPAQPLSGRWKAVVYFDIVFPGTVYIPFLQLSSGERPCDQGFYRTRGCGTVTAMGCCQTKQVGADMLEAISKRAKCYGQGRSRVSALEWVGRGTRKALVRRQV